MDISERFGALVRARREYLNLTQADVAAAGGPSTVTIGKVESGAYKPSARTLKKLDTVLGWTYGSAARAWAGGDPVPVERAAGRSDLAWPAGPLFRLGPESVPLDLAELTDLLEISGSLDAAIDDDTSPPIADAARGLSRLLSTVFARYATALLERSGGPDRALNPVVEMALAHLLDAPPDADGQEELEDRRYRRWLAGRLPALDEPTKARFRARWEASIATHEDGSQ